jgi:uncharacterized membrane protein
MNSTKPAQATYTIREDKITIRSDNGPRFIALLIAFAIGLLIMVGVYLLFLLNPDLTNPDSVNVIRWFFPCLIAFQLVLMISLLLYYRKIGQEVLVVTSTGIRIEGRKAPNAYKKEEISRVGFLSRTAPTRIFEIYTKDGKRLQTHELALSANEIPLVEKAIKNLLQLS